MSRRIECPTCGRDGFQNEKGMRIHHARAHDESIAEQQIATCDYCGEQFEVKPGSTGVYCSNECQGLAQRDRVELECKQCGDSFEVEQAEAQKGRKYCSQKCYATSLENRVEKHCSGCGRSFSTPRKTDNDYCSRACMGEHRTAAPRPADLDGLIWVLYVYEGHTAHDTWLRVNHHTDEWMTKQAVKSRLRENDWMIGGGRPKYGDLSLEDVGLTDSPDGDETWHKYYNNRDDGVRTDGGGRTYRDLKGVGSWMDVERPEWATDYGVGDPITFDTPRGEISASVAGFSLRDEYRGLPVVEMPDELADLYDGGVLVVREQDLATNDLSQELCSDGGVGERGDGDA